MGQWCNCIECIGDQPDPTDEDLAAERSVASIPDADLLGLVDRGVMMADLVGMNEEQKTAAPTAYQQRAIDQGRKWVAGESHHNRVDDECCPDFSCCAPELFERDRAKRVTGFNAYARQYGWPQIVDA